jgi:hypothetical protein
MDLKKISIILSIIIAAAAIVGGVMKYDRSIAKAEDLRPIQQSIQQLNQRLDRWPCQGKGTKRRDAVRFKKEDILEFIEYSAFFIGQFIKFKGAKNGYTRSAVSRKSYSNGTRVPHWH